MFIMGGVGDMARGMMSRNITPPSSLHRIQQIRHSG